MIVTRLVASTTEVLAGTGWDLKPQGACRGELCVPLPAETWASDGRVLLQPLAERLGMPIVADDASGAYAIGPATMSGHALVGAEAPDVTLADLDGGPFALRELRGRKICLIAWAPY